MADGGRVAVLERDFHHVEATARVAHAATSQIPYREAHEPALLVPRHGRARGVVPAPPPRLDLDEDPGVGLSTDEIDLAARETHVAVDHAETRARQPARGVLLGRRPERAPPVARMFARVHGTSRTPFWPVGKE